MKPLDYVIAALIVGCMFVGYSGHRFIAILLLMLVVIVASWRFWDRRHERELVRSGGSDELNPNHDNWADLSPSHDSSGADTGDDD